MGKIKIFTALVLLLGVLGFGASAKADNQASFSFSTGQQTFAENSDIIVDLNVDAGTYASTLNTIDFTVQISDTSILEPSNTTAPYTAGSIFSKIGINDYSNGTIHAVTYVDPDNKPTNRSGVVGSIAFKAKKSGNVTLTYGDINAAEEGSELGFISTVASTLTMNIDAGNTAPATTTTKSSQVKGSAVSAAKTGPEDVIIIAILGAVAIFSFYKYSQRGRYI